MLRRLGAAAALLFAALAPGLAVEPLTEAERQRAIAYFVELSDAFGDATWSFEAVARQNAAGEAMTIVCGRVLTAADQRAGAGPLRFTVWMNGTMNGVLVDGNIRGDVC